MLTTIMQKTVARGEDLSSRLSGRYTCSVAEQRQTFSKVVSRTQSVTLSYYCVNSKIRRHNVFSNSSFGFERVRGRAFRFAASDESMTLLYARHLGQSVTESLMCRLAKVGTL